MTPGTRVIARRIPSDWRRAALVGTVLRPSAWAKLARRIARTPRARTTLVQWDADVSPVWCDPTELRAVTDQPAGRVR